MLVKLCARCKKIINYNDKYCSSCKEIAEKQKKESEKISNKRYNNRRDDKYIKFYNSKAWRTLSKKYMYAHRYLCEDCQEEAKSNNSYTVQLAEECHHNQPIQTEQGWKRRLDYTNLIALCHYHHNKRHKRFSKQREKKKGKGGQKSLQELQNNCAWSIL